MDMKKKVVPKLFVSITTVFCLVAFLSCDYQKSKVVEGKSEFEIEAIQDSIISKDSLLTFDSTSAKEGSDSYCSYSDKKMNKSNLVVKEWNTNVTTNVRVLDHITTYNAEGKKTEEIEYNSEGQKWRERYEYDARGNKIRELVYNGNNRLVYVKKYRYNEYGKKEMTLTYNSQGKLIAIKNYEYLIQ